MYFITVGISLGGGNFSDLSMDFFPSNLYTAPALCNSPEHLLIFVICFITSLVAPISNIVILRSLGVCGRSYHF